jgi:hypothetical protein
MIHDRSRGHIRTSGLTATRRAEAWLDCDSSEIMEAIMRIYTCQIAGRQKAVGLVLDTTVKSGAGLGKILAPTWDIVMGVKDGHITPEQYTGRYLELLRQRFRRNKQEFLEILQHDQVTLLCYCRPGDFCHRHLAVDVLEKISARHGITCECGGECR